MYTWTDSIEEAETELDEFSYSYVIKDKEGEIVALVCTETIVKLIVDTLNK